MKKSFLTLFVCLCTLGTAWAADKPVEVKVSESQAKAPNQYSAADAATSIESIYNTLASTDKLPAYNVSFAYIHGVVESALVMELATSGKGANHSTLCGMFEPNGQLKVKLGDAVRAVIAKFSAAELDTEKKRNMGAAQYILSKLDLLYGCAR